MSIPIDIILDGKPFAARWWQAIPRVGEMVLLRNGEIWAEVTQVVWGDDSKTPPSKQSERQWVQLLCKTIDKPDCG